MSHEIDTLPHIETTRRAYSFNRKSWAHIHKGSQDIFGVCVL